MVSSYRGVTAMTPVSVVRGRATRQVKGGAGRGGVERLENLP